MQIRKEKKEDQVQKRRLAGFSPQGTDADQVFGGSSSSTFSSSSSAPGGSTSTGFIPAQVSPQYIQQCTQNIHSTDSVAVLKATQQFRRILSIEKNPPIQAVIDTGVIPRLVLFLQMNDNPVRSFLSFHFHSSFFIFK